MRTRPYGADAVLLETDESPAAVWRQLRAAGHEAVAEVVPAAQTVLVRFVPGRPRPDLEVLLAANPDVQAHAPRPTLELAVHYDGHDLDSVADAAGLSREALVARHAGAEYTVAFCGFSPGFGYLTGLPPDLHLPRRAEPRTRVPAGAVAIAGPYTGVYPRPSPGGWQLLGHTDAALWNTDRDPPAELTPGRRVRFVRVHR